MSFASWYITLFALANLAIFLRDWHDGKIMFHHREKP